MLPTKKKAAKKAVTKKKVWRCEEDSEGEIDWDSAGEQRLPWLDDDDSYDDIDSIRKRVAPKKRTTRGKATATTAAEQEESLSFSRPEDGSNGVCAVVFSSSSVTSHIVPSKIDGGLEESNGESVQSFTDIHLREGKLLRVHHYGEGKDEQCTSDGERFSDLSEISQGDLEVRSANGTNSDDTLVVCQHRNLLDSTVGTAATPLQPGGTVGKSFNRLGRVSWFPPSVPKKVQSQRDDSTTRLTPDTSPSAAPVHVVVRKWKTVEANLERKTGLDTSTKTRNIAESFYATLNRARFQGVPKYLARVADPEQVKDLTRISRSLATAAGRFSTGGSPTASNITVMDLPLPTAPPPPPPPQ